MRKIKIGIDISNLSSNFYGGIDTYCNGLIKGFSKGYKNCEFQIYLNKEYFENRKKNFLKKKNFKFIVTDISIYKKFLLKIYNRILPNVTFLISKKKYYFDYILKNFIYNEFKYIVEKNSDILISPNVLLKSYDLKIPTLLNMQDIQQVHFPHFFNNEENNRREMQYYNSAFFASHMIASGYFIKKDFLKKFPFLKEKTSIILEGVDVRKFSKKITNKKAEMFFLKNKVKKNSFLFLPAQLWLHKNHITILKGMKLLKNIYKNNIKLVMCGQKYEYTNFLFEFIKKNNLTNVIYLNTLEEEMVKWCFQNSFATICPALYESSSLVNLESISAKTIIFSSDIPTNIEKKKFFKVNIFKKKNPRNFAKIVNNLIKNPIIRTNQIKYNSKRINHFSWKITSKKYYLKCLEMLNEKK